MSAKDRHLPDRRVVIAALGPAQILAWGTSFYFPAVFAGPIVADTGWSLGYVVSGTSIGLLIGGLISPQVGKYIGKHGGRSVLLASSVLFAAGLGGIGLSPTLAFYLLSWIVLGLGMGTGLYDAVFSTLGRIYGHDARGPITNLTLFGGFASTICWPLSAYLIDIAGWRGACLIYAGLHLAVSLPLQAAVIRRERQVEPESVSADTVARVEPPRPNESAVLLLLALVMAIASGVGAVIVVHLLIFLQARGIEFAAAVALGTLFGPAQVGARLIERLFGSRYHPLWTLVASCSLMAIGLIMLFGGIRALIMIILIYGSGYGILWIARGTVPLALFGPLRFPIVMGRLAFPSLIVQALAPAAGAWVIDVYGTNATLALLSALAMVNVALVGVLWLLCRRTL